MAIAYETNCAGQGCPDTETCRRHQLRMPAKTAGPVARPAFEWASLDIERQLQGDCLNFIRYHERSH